MNTTTTLSLVAILASCFSASMAIGSAQAAMRHHQAATALCCPAGHYEGLFLSGTRGARETVTSSAR